MQFATVNDLTIHYVLNGLPDSQALVFINALGTDLRIWDDVIPHLGGQLRLVRYDKRGHGLSSCPAGPYSIQDHADDLDGLLNGLHITSAVLVGISVGGLIAMAYAAAHAEQVRALVLCDTGLTIGSPAMWDERIAAIRWQGIAEVGESIITRWFAPTFCERQPAVYRGCYHMLTRTPPEGYIATCAAIRDANLTHAAQAITAPTLVVCGAQDIATPPEQGLIVADTLPNGRFTVIEQAGHLPCIEQPEVLADVVQRFLEEQGCVRSTL